MPKLPAICAEAHAVPGLPLNCCGMTALSGEFDDPLLQKAILHPPELFRSAGVTSMLGSCKEFLPVVLADGDVLRAGPRGVLLEALLWLAPVNVNPTEGTLGVAFLRAALASDGAVTEPGVDLADLMLGEVREEAIHAGAFGDCVPLELRS